MDFTEEWMEKFDNQLNEAREKNVKFFIIDAPKDTFTKTISAAIIKKMMNLKITGEKTKKWKIVFTGKKPKKLSVTVVKLK